MGDARTATTRTLGTSETPRTVPGWSELLDRLEAKEERISELEAEVEKLRSEVGRDGEVRGSEGSDSTEEERSTARELVDALRRTAESAE